MPTIYERALGLVKDGTTIGLGSGRAASAFVRRLHEEQRRDPRQPLQLNEYFGSITALHTEAMGAPAVRAA